MTCLKLSSLFLLTCIPVIGQSAHPAVGPKKEQGVQLVRNDAAHRVDVLIDGKPFTSYIWPEKLKKPVLYPLRAADGTIVTRGFPLDPRPGERADHPHQVGLWFNYGDVNGVDFWNNSDVRTPQEKTHMGTIVHRRIVSTKDGRDSGELTVEADWLMPDNSTVLREKSRYIFRGGPSLRSVDRITTLTALDKLVVFKDSKEGTLGIRVRRELELPSTEPLILVDENGKPVKMPKQINSGLTGQFRSSEGLTGDAVWGTRGRWATLTGTVDSHPITLAILDDPKNVGYPTYWMARGYGLFAANPLGQRAYRVDKKEPDPTALNYTLKPNQSVTFRYRVLVLTNTVTPEQIEDQYRRFTREAK
jgi:Methane oxygenase PmoA